MNIQAMHQRVQQHCPTLLGLARRLPALAYAVIAVIAYQAGQYLMWDEIGGDCKLNEHPFCVVERGGLWLCLRKRLRQSLA